MALIVKSKRGEGALHRFNCTSTVARRVVGALVEDNRSFYYEPLPDNMGEIVVDEEHAAFVREHVSVLSYGEVVE